MSSRPEPEETQKSAEAIDTQPEVDHHEIRIFREIDGLAVDATRVPSLRHELLDDTLSSGLRACGLRDVSYGWNLALRKPADVYGRRIIVG